ncbi:acyl carrier protein [Streptomyces sp. NRRL S-31]|uniref:acyl carrier protein n=1 Tax=Streptomyces sp. NRRL S-31 TaxID=1463898 RepID=UPI00069BB275|nr:acyl carrier protein [Streptomyces sp. NRRL S-31]
MQQDLTDVIEELVTRRVRAGADGAAGDPDTGLHDRGVDSLGIVGLIVDIERTLGVRFPAALITADTFASVRSVAAAVHGLTEGDA